MLARKAEDRTVTFDRVLASGLYASSGCWPDCSHLEWVVPGSLMLLLLILHACR